METLNSLLAGFAVALTPTNLMFGFIGVFLGTLVGVLPGIGPALTVALLLPVTFKVEPVAAFIMFAGIYYGAMYGGSTTSILLNTPGESASIITSLEGNKMARAGRGAAALATAAIGSFVAGTIATIALTFFAPVAVNLALAFGAAEYFSMMLLAFITVSAVLGSNPLRGMMSLLFGVLLGLVGTDVLTGQSRFDLGFPELFDGVEIVIVVVGLFAVGETLYVASRFRELGGGAIIKLRERASMTKQDWARSWKPWLRGTLLGFPFGVMPAGGAEIPTFLSYALEKRLTKYPEEFGKGAIEGVAGPEAANNASAAGVLVPLLTLGLPTSATAAIMLAAFQQYGIQPGPLLFTNNASLVWGLIASLYIGNTMLLILNLPLAGVWVRLLEIPRPLLYGGILIFASIGVYSLNNSVFDLALLGIIGVIGYMMRRFDIPIAPAVVGMILGPKAEEQFRRAMGIAQGDASVFFTRPISATILTIAILALITPPLLKLWNSRKAAVVTK